MMYVLQNMSCHTKTKRLFLNGFPIGRLKISLFKVQLTGDVIEYFDCLFMIREIFLNFMVKSALNGTVGTVTVPQNDSGSG
jgi:hypothetical protein